MSKPTTSPEGQFVFVCCQVGAESALKRDVARRHPYLTFAFSRPGFVTFKKTEPVDVDAIESPFARTFGFSIGSVRKSTSPIAAAATLLGEHATPAPFNQLHVWQRDRAVPGERQFEPHITEEATKIGSQIYEAAPTAFASANVNHKARPGDRVADVIVVDEDNWFVGCHQAQTIASCWPGGIPPLKPKESMISRAYLKMEEALKWSRLPIQAGDLCVELGSSPGGACQALLDRRLHVIGIDPAIMDPRVLEHPNFTHFRARAADLKRKEFADVRWLMTDANLAPASTLDAVESIVTHRQVNIPGLLLTLKLLDEKMTDEIDAYLQRIRGWGYRHVRARQLAFNRHEICVLAARSKGKMRMGSRRKSATPEKKTPIDSPAKSPTPE